MSAILKNASSAQLQPSLKDDNNIKVMIVDDSVVVRGLVSRWVEETPGMHSVGKFSNGLKAVEGVIEADPDIIVLDIEMPVMDGLEALPKILKLAPKVKIIMASTLTQRNAEISLNALSLGAADYVPKPVSNSGVTTSTAFKRDLIEKIRALAKKSKFQPTARVQQDTRPGSNTVGVTKASVKVTNSNQNTSTYSLRSFSKVRPRIIVIGSSTGGPPAVMKVLEELVGVSKYVPILIAQHMPSTFTGIFANHIARSTGIDTHEGIDGEDISPGTIYVAPGGKHMIIERDGTKPIIRLTDDAEVNFCKPAVDPLFDAAATVYGAATLATVFTGMGVDGAAGSVKIADAGGSVIAQDEATSVVWGMPGAAAKSGSCSAILPVNQIAKQLTQLIQGNSR